MPGLRKTFLKGGGVLRGIFKFFGEEDKARQVRGIFLVILLCEINNTKFSRGGRGGGSCPTLSPLLCGINFPWGKGGSGPLSSSSVHEKGMSHN